MAFASVARRGRKLSPEDTGLRGVLLLSAAPWTKAPFPAGWLHGPAHCHDVLGVGVRESEIFI